MIEMFENFETNLKLGDWGMGGQLSMKCVSEHLAEPPEGYTRKYSNYFENRVYVRYPPSPPKGLAHSRGLTGYW